MLKRIALTCLALALSCAGAFAQTVSCSGPTGGNCVPTVLYSPSGQIGVPANSFIGSADPCTYALKSSAAFNISTVTTTSLVALSGTTSVYVCGFSMTIAPSATSADIAAFVYGTGAACVTGQTGLTGAFGSGAVPAANTTAPVPVSYGNGGATIFKAPSANGVCLVTSGTAVAVNGVITYVQQ